MQIIKYDCQVTLHDVHLEQCLGLAHSNYSPDYEQLANNMQNANMQYHSSAHQQNYLIPPLWLVPNLYWLLYTRTTIKTKLPKYYSVYIVTVYIV